MPKVNQDFDFTVNKKDLQKVYNSILKLAFKFSSLTVVVEKDGIWLIISLDYYVKVFVPASVVNKGKFIVEKENFDSIFGLRGDALKCSYNIEQNILNITCGTRTELYVNYKINKSEIDEPEIENDNCLPIESQTVGDFKNMLNTVKFISPDNGASDYALVRNTKHELSITFASTNIYAKYVFTKSISKKEFEFCIPIDKIKLALSLVESRMEMIFNDSYIVIKSDSLILRLPTIIDNDLFGLIEACEKLKDNTSLIKGALTVNTKNWQDILASVRAVSVTGNNSIEFMLKDTKLLMKLETTFGNTKDAYKLEKNTIQDQLKFGILEKYIDSSLLMAKTINTISTMRFGEDLRYYALYQENDDATLTVIGPINVEDARNE